MSDVTFLTQSGPELANALLMALRADTDVQAVLGEPARIFDAETSAPAFPYVRLNLHDSQTADRVARRRLEHTIQLATYSRPSGLESTKALLGVLRAAVDRLSLTLSIQDIVQVAISSDEARCVGNGKDQRGLLHLRILTEAKA
ncbi:MAG: DUF3168 domain-containing protein [Pseudomonadota bacterium]